MFVARRQWQTAHQLVESAIDNKGKIDVDKIDQAIALAPYDADLRLQKAVLLTATGQDPTKSIGEARYIAQIYPFSSSMHSSDGTTVSIFIEDLDDALKKFEPTSIEYSRLHKQVCAQRRLFSAEYDYGYHQLPEDCKS